MRKAAYYRGQFATTPDYVHVTIPQHEIVAEMAQRGEAETLNNVCLAVAVVADLISQATTASVE